MIPLHPFFPIFFLLPIICPEGYHGQVTVILQITDLEIAETVADSYRMLDFR